MTMIDYYYDGFNQIAAPFYLNQKTIKVSQLEKLWDLRITSKMSEHMIQVIHNQVMQFYIYLIFNLRVVDDDYEEEKPNDG